MSLPEYEVPQNPPLPQGKWRVLSIGAGDIVRNAHYPAYRLAGFELAGLFDSRPETASATAALFQVPFVAKSIAELASRYGERTAFDLALPASAIASVLPQLPDGAVVLMQKPMGENTGQAEEIVEICQRKNLNAAVNFQLRTAPYVLAAKRLIADGIIGTVHEVDVKINLHTPWERWSFLEGVPAMELYYHSIHYLDLVRDLLGEPSHIQGLLSKHPLTPNLDCSRSATVLGFEGGDRATVVTNHGHVYGGLHQESSLRIEGSAGSIVIQMGLNLNYPDGGEDYLHLWPAGGSEWHQVPLKGSWFPHAFIGSMGSLMKAAEESKNAPTQVEDSLKTMQLLGAIVATSQKPHR